MGDQVRANENGGKTRSAFEFIRNWVIPGAAVIAAGTAMYLRLESMCVENDRDIKELKEGFLKLMRLGDLGEYGVKDQTIHGILDAHIEKWHRQELGKTGWLRLMRDYGDGEDKDKEDPVESIPGVLPGK